MSYYYGGEGRRRIALPQQRKGSLSSMWIWPGNYDNQYESNQTSAFSTLKDAGDAVVENMYTSVSPPVSLGFHGGSYLAEASNVASGNKAGELTLSRLNVLFSRLQPVLEA